MLFTKSAPVVSRSALAKSKKFWGTSSSSSQNTVGPGFFVSTPQFNRHQQCQVAPYYEDTHGAGNSSTTSDSHGIDNPYLALTAGANSAGGAPGLLFDEEVKDEGSSRPKAHATSSLSSRTPQLKVASHPQDINATATLFSSDANIDPVAEAIDQVGKLTVIDGMLEKMYRLHDAGSHTAVLATFEILETIQPQLPVEAYNLVLESLVSTCDINTQLEAYEKMLTRGVRPSDATYCIILNSLANTAESLASVREELSPYLGTTEGILESVDEIHEGLAVEEYLQLSQSIFQAIVATHPRPWSDELQACLDRIVQLSIKNNLSIPDSLLQVVTKNSVSLIDMESSIQSAAERFSSLSPRQQQSDVAQVAMMRSYFKFKEPSGAIAFYSGCGSPAYLLKPLLVGFASGGYVGTARNWADKLNANTDTVSEVLGAIPVDDNVNEVLPSATELFYRLVGGGGGGSSGDGRSDNKDGSSLSHKGSVGRCAYIRLCVAAENEEALFMAIRESHLSDSTWDAVTVSEVLGFLITREQPLLAADICSWQVPKLVSAYESKELKGYVDQEVVSDLVNQLQRNGLFSLNVALRILPVVLRCSSARKHVIDVITDAKLEAPHELSKLITSDNLSVIVSSLATIMVSSTHCPTDEELSALKRILPLFVHDSLHTKSEFAVKDILNVEQALELCPDVEPLIYAWTKSHVHERSLVATSPTEASLAIQRYALAHNGLDNALSILKDQLRLQRTVTIDAINAVIFSCVKHQLGQILQPLYEMLPKAQSSLSSLMVASSQTGQLDLARKCQMDLVDHLGVYPSYAAYLESVKAEKADWARAYALFQEAKNDAGLPIESELYNVIAMVLADHLRNAELATVLMEMQDKGFNIAPPTYESILGMYIKLNKGHQALSILKQMPITTKSLLEVKVFNRMMDYFVHASPDRHCALEVFMELRNVGTLATPLTYGLLMEAYLLRDEGEQPSLENADSVLSLMRRDGAPISTQCFATLLRARGVLFKDFEGARNFYRGLVKNSRVLPDRGIFQALIESCIINGRDSETRVVLDEMKRYHVPIDEGISSLVTSSR